jgi:predicted nucleic acid-binding protein
MRTSTSSSFVIDSYAWVEYLIGSRIGTKAKDYVETGQALTPSIVLVELRKWYLREIEEGHRSEREMQLHFQFIESATEVVPLDASLALKAGETDFLMKKRIRNWPIANSVIYATARSRAAQIVTGDSYFRGLEEVIFLE